MALDVKEMFHDFWQNFLSIAGQSVTASAAQIPAVQEKIEEAKTTEAKNILWRYFPVLTTGLIIFLLIRSRR